MADQEKDLLIKLLATNMFTMSFLTILSYQDLIIRKLPRIRQKVNNFICILFYQAKVLFQFVTGAEDDLYCVKRKKSIKLKFSPRHKIYFDNQEIKDLELSASTEYFVTSTEVYVERKEEIVPPRNELEVYRGTRNKSKTRKCRR
ncbi:uncharacterized protein LOC124153510 [Ischnura elegans]|uniref:uncharacterized protein LOC124153510 n=1 Tax=Ischnura elegans TaxID=197161 RepID=UPI001ED8AD65|nr:uncharacterized protein LOC124153510 [Ischnura elegans]